MKNMLAIAVLCLLSLSLAAGQKASTANGVEDQINKLEHNWAQAIRQGRRSCRGPI